MEHLLPGDIGFTQIGGALGVAIKYGQRLIDGKRVFHAFEDMEFEPTHVRVVTAPSDYSGTPAKAIEAMPSGAREISILSAPDPSVVYVRLPLSDRQRRIVTSYAKPLLGCRYGFSDYLSLAVKHWGVNWGWLENYIVNNNRMICSQLADEVLHRVGYKVFDDGRLPHDVTPGDLFSALSTQGQIFRRVK